MLGALAAVALVMAVIKPALIAGVLATAGYVAYRLFSSGSQALPGNEHEALPASSAADDFARRMRELDAIEKNLDAQIRKHS